MPVPLDFAIRTDEWQDESSGLNHIVPSAEAYKNGLFLAKLQISKMTIKQLYLHLRSTHALFDFTVNYDREDNSKIVLLEWLKFQFSLDTGKTFMYELYRLLTRESLRKYAMYLFGQPQCSKTTIQKLIHDAMITAAFVSNKMNSSSFAFSNLIDCRIALWDEPHIKLDSSKYY